MTAGAERLKRYRQRQRDKGEPDASRRHRKTHDQWARFDRKFEKKAKDRAFVGCDGEGCGTDERGRQLYMLFRMGERELFTGSHLSTAELLDFICDSDRSALLVGFAFGYDVTMILRDLSRKQLDRLFLPKVFGAGHSPFTWYKNFDIEYLPRQYFRVRRVKIERDQNGIETRSPIKGSVRTIYETFGFFQKSFVKTIESFEVGTKEQRLSIAADKARRSDFTEISQRERDYCALECVFLAELMEKLRDYCHDADIHPYSWNGAGKLASALHKREHTPEADTIADLVPKSVSDLANMAYYGGRFEITRTGLIGRKVYEYDICSAYPDGMRNLPCLLHGRWEEKKAAALRDHHGLFIAGCSFKTGLVESGFGQLGGLPIRSKEGHLYWPCQGAGVYWSPEIRSAEKLGAKIRLGDGWAYISNCDCRPFDWVERLYNYRKSIGSQGAGYPIKLGINSLYGKLAQRKGNGKYVNMVWAGLITALTRTKINNAISKNPGRIVMVATDAVYSLDPLDGLPCSDSLGDWEAHELPGLFIVQPGLYWCPEKRKRKSRGLSGSFFEKPGLTESFEKEWEYYHAKENSKLVADFPSVTVPVPGFIGLRLALARNKPLMAGTWVSDTRDISFDYRNKRSGHQWNHGAIVTGIKPGYPGLVSLPHKDFLKAGGQEPWENARLMLEEQPDFIDMSIPFKD